MQKGKIVEDNLAGKGSKQIVPDLELPQLLEATDLRHFSDQILIP